MESNLQLTSYKPHQNLSHYIDYYWIARCTNGSLPLRNVNVVPITMHSLILFFGDIPYRVYNKEELVCMPKKCVIGIISKNQNYILKDNMYFISIRFKPLGLYRLFNYNPIEFTDGNIDFDNRKINELYEQLGETKSPILIIQKLNTFFLKNLDYYDYKEYRIKSIKYCVRKIFERNGNIPLKYLHNELNMSERNFRLFFKNCTGISPKLFSRIVRFDFVYQYLINNKNLSVSDILYEAGYFDQSHFIKEFKYFTNSTITSYHSNFMEFDKLHHRHL